MIVPIEENLILFNIASNHRPLF